MNGWVVVVFCVEVAFTTLLCGCGCVGVCALLFCCCCFCVVKRRGGACDPFYFVFSCFACVPSTPTRLRARTPALRASERAGGAAHAQPCTHQPSCPPAAAPPHPPTPPAPAPALRPPNPSPPPHPSPRAVASAPPSGMMRGLVAYARQSAASPPGRLVSRCGDQEEEVLGKSALLALFAQPPPFHAPFSSFAPPFQRTATT